MKNNNRIFIVGQPGTGKALFSRLLARALNYEFLDDDIGLEMRFGRRIQDILNENGAHSFQESLNKVLVNRKKQSNLIINTDSSIVLNNDNCQELSSEIVIYLQVSVPVQLKRLSRHPDTLLNVNIEKFLTELHEERDTLYANIAKFIIDTDDSAVEKHVNNIVKLLTTNAKMSQAGNMLKLKNYDLIFFHKIHRIPVFLSNKQAKYLKFLAEGKSSKQIAKALHVSHRTVEHSINRIAELLGCTTSKELIALYYGQP